MAGNELAHREEGAVTAAQGSAVTIPMDQQMAMMREALTNPDVNPDKAREMFALMREMMNDAKQAEFNRDKIAAKKEMPAIYKRGYNSHQKTKHVLFEDMQRAIDPVLERHNLMLEFDLSRIPGGDIQVIPILRHTNGWVERGGALSGPPDAGPGRTPIQSIGSSGSYLKRYAAEAILNLVRDGEDNDGQIITETTLLNDRQQAVAAEAERVAGEGHYDEWYKRQSVKDRAWLVTSGRHQLLTSETGNTLTDQRAVDRQQRQPAQQLSEREAKTLEQVEKYEATVNKFTKRSELRAYQLGTKIAEWIKWLADNDKAASERVIAFNSKRMAELADDQGGDDMFPGEVK